MIELPVFFCFFFLSFFILSFFLAKHVRSWVYVALLRKPLHSSRKSGYDKGEGSEWKGLRSGMQSGIRTLIEVYRGYGALPRRAEIDLCCGVSSDVVVPIAAADIDEVVALQTFFSGLALYCAYHCHWSRGPASTNDIFGWSFRIAPEAVILLAWSKKGAPTTIRLLLSYY